jgi:hypothetical protein
MLVQWEAVRMISSTSPWPPLHSDTQEVVELAEVLHGELLLKS